MTTKNSAKSRNKLFERYPKFVSRLPENDYLTFAIKSRLNPSAAFADLHRSFVKAVEEDKQLASAFSKFMKNFKGVALTEEDAAIIADLKKRHGDLKPEIKVGSLPPQIGPGLALMYAVALEGLRSGVQPVPYIFNARTIRLAEKSLSNFLALIGSATVTAYKLALDDKDFADKLLWMGSELGTTMHLDQPPDILCEHCQISVKDQTTGQWDNYCGSKEECETLGGLFLLALVIWGLYELIDWLW